MHTNHEEPDRRTPSWRAWLSLLGRLLWRLVLYWHTPRPSERPGMGAVPYDGGTTFRVWAPHAESVHVAGSFNGWSTWRHKLAQGQNGYWSADIAGVQPGAEYKYIIRAGEQVLTRSDPYARDVTPAHQNSVVVAPDPPLPVNAGYRTPARDELIIYELHVGTFADDRGRPPGTFDGVIARLPYLRDLGVNVIQLMPVAEFPGDYSWGYNPAHPFAVSRTYGGRDGFKRLIDAAHAHGMAVILDVVYNHFGPDNLSLWQFDGWSENGLGGIYFYNDWRSKTPWADTRPDYGRPEVRRYIRDNVMQWLDEFQVDGLRWDATNYIRTVGGFDGHDDALADGWRLMQGINAELYSRFPWKIAIAEDLQNNDGVTQTLDSGGAGFSAQWDARFVHPVRAALTAVSDADRDLHAVADALRASYNGDPFQRVVYTESHDEVANGKARLTHEINHVEPDSWFGRKRTTLGAGLVLTAPGIPMLFQGQEFLEDEWFRDTDPLEWARAERYAGIVELYRDLIALRRDCAGTTRGLRGRHIDVTYLDNADKVLAYRRWDQGGPGDDVVVAANFANSVRADVALPFPAPGTWRVRFCSADQRYDPAFSGLVTADVTVAVDSAESPLTAPVTIAPYTLVIFSQDRQA